MTNRIAPRTRTSCNGSPSTGDDIGIRARLDDANPIFDAEEFGGLRGRGADRCYRLHAELDHVGELLPVVPVRIDSGVRSERETRSTQDSLTEILKRLDATDGAFFLIDSGSIPVFSPSCRM